MKKLIFKFLFLTYCLLGPMQRFALCQEKQSSANHITTKFENQGKQEEYWAKQLFDTTYKPANFALFKYRITRDGNVFTFGDESITLSEDIGNYDLIFKNGLLYPGILNGGVKTRKLNESELQELTEQQRILYNFGRTDNIVIGAFEECKYLNSNVKQRRFKFWLSRQGMLNPTVYFFELTNDKANSRTSTQKFLEGARLTFLKEGWVII